MMNSQDHESILEHLQSPDEEIRRLAVERLSVLSSAEAIPALVERLGDSSWRVRKAAIERLAAASDAPYATRCLVDALADGENTGRRNAALEALMRCGRKAIPTLIKASHHEDADVRKQVADALAGIGHESAADRLMEMLADVDPNVRGASADALAAVGSASSVSALVAAANADEERLVRLSALCALGRMEAPVAMSDVANALGVSMLRPAAYALLGYSEDPAAFDWLLKGAIDGSRSSREAAFEALLRWIARSDGVQAERLTERIREAFASNEGILPDALARLSSAGLRTRLTLVQFLGLLKRPDTVMPILTAGADEALSEIALSTLESFGSMVEDITAAEWESLESDLRRLACELLGRLSGEAGQDRLVASLHECDAVLRIAAARALGHRGRASALPELVRRLEAVAVDQADRDGEQDEEIESITEAIVAIATARNASKCGVTEQAVELLSSRGEGADECFRLAVARTLGRIGRAEDAAAVGFMMSDPSASVRRAAVEALARLALGVVPEALRMALADEAPVVRIAAASALGGSGDLHAIDDLASLAGDKDFHVRAAAMRALGSIAATLRSRGGDSDAASRALIILSAALEDEGAVAISALETLGALGGSEAAQLAARTLGKDDPELVTVAIQCIRSHGNDEALQDLLPLISHDHWLVRSEAIEALADRGVERAVPTMLRRYEKEQDDFVRETIVRALKRLET